MTKYIVEVVKYATDGKEEEVVKRMDCGESERRAERVEDGVMINLNHDYYFTRIVTEEA